MSPLNTFVRSTVGKKWLVGITGLALALFVLIHMSGNLLLFAGPEAYNSYSHKLTSNPFIYIAEAGLVLFFFTHVFLASQLALANRVSRPISPHQAASMAKAARFGSKSMIYTGALVFVFTILHLITFKYGADYPVAYGGVEMRDLYRLVAEKFQSPLYVGWYLLSMVILGIHLSHGFAATFQTMGFASVRNCTMKKIGWAFAFIVAGGFFTQPLYMLLKGGH